MINIKIRSLFDINKNISRVEFFNIFNTEDVVYSHTSGIGKLLVDLINLDVEDVLDKLGIKPRSQEDNSIGEYGPRLSELIPKTEMELKERIAEIDSFYTRLIECNYLFLGLKLNYEDLKDQYEVLFSLVTEHYEDTEPSILDSLNYPHNLYEPIYDFIDRQDKYINAIGYCLDVDCIKELKELSLVQRYYYFTTFIDEWDINVDLNYTFQNRIESKGNLTLTEKVALIKGNSINMVEVFEGDLWNSCSLELIKMINNNIQVKKCKHCKKYFILEGRPTAEYCERVIEGESGPCNIVGPRKKYEKNIKNDPIMYEYRKAYKTHNARVRIKKMNNHEFLNWTNIAKDKLGQAKEGIITLEEFREWLKK